jgi:adenylosuccinate lyase
LISKTEWLIDGLAVYPSRMRANLESLGGVTASGQLLLELTKKGVSREDAYAIVQPLAMRVLDDRANFHNLVMNDKRVTEKLTREELDELFDVNKQLRNVDKIFERVFEE